MTESLLTISAFARAVDLSPGTLRYYDEAGLLRPAEVDARTGYRYYTADLERRAHLIRRMREVGVPIETMRRVLDGPVDEALAALREFGDDAHASAALTQRAIADVITSLQQQPTDPSTIEAAVDGPELATALQRVSAATDDAPDSPLGVVALDLEADTLTVAATNRYWMATWLLRPQLHSPFAVDRRFVVLRDDIAPMIDWLTRTDHVRVIGDENTMLFADGEQPDLTVSLVEDRFPAFRILVAAAPTSYGRASVDRARLLAALSDGEQPVVIRVGTDRVTVRTAGDVEGVRLDATTTGRPIEAGFSPGLLRSAVTAVVGTEVMIAYDAPDRAVRITSPAQRNFTALVMPVRLDSQA